MVSLTAAEPLASSSMVLMLPPAEVTLPLTLRLATPVWRSVAPSVTVPAALVDSVVAGPFSMHPHVVLRGRRRVVRGAAGRRRRSPE